MTSLILALLISNPQPKCNYRVVVFQKGLPTCTIQVISKVTATGYDKESLYQDIQNKVCEKNGHAIIRTVFESKDGNRIASGWAVRCNVPFLLPSDMRAR